jgi:hypothetical protein
MKGKGKERKNERKRKGRMKGKGKERKNEMKNEAEGKGKEIKNEEWSGWKGNEECEREGTGETLCLADLETEG